jgi:hypothetical protein
MDYRSIAREKLAKATQLLSSNESDNLAHACLELRKCIEALCYDLLGVYLKEVPLRALEVWQPDKVMKELLRIDPQAHSTTRIRMRREGHDGSPDSAWRDLGEDRRLKPKFAEKAYQQLSNFIHVPTIKQLQVGKCADESIIRERAQRIRDKLAHTLAATIWNANFGGFYTFNCTECESPIARRQSVLDMGEDVECGNCGQQYDVEKEPDGKLRFIARSYSWECAACGERREIAQRLAKDGLDVSCRCGDVAFLRAVIGWHLERPSSIENPTPAEDR